jgi:hypothetical protein
VRWTAEIIGVCAHGHAARIWRAGARCGAGRGAAGLCSLRGACTVTGRRKGNSPLADEWDPLTIERKRKKKRGVPAGPAWLLGRGSKVAPGKEVGPLLDLVSWAGLDRLVFYLDLVLSKVFSY